MRVSEYYLSNGQLHHVAMGARIGDSSHRGPVEEVADSLRASEKAKGMGRNGMEWGGAE